MASLRRITNLFLRSRVEREIDQELRSHIEMRIEDNLAAGMSLEEARKNAMLRFGNPIVMKERATAADASLGLENVIRDLRYALRNLRHSKGFAFTAILTLAVGIGANVIVFGVLNALLLRPLNVAGADRLFEIIQTWSNTQSYPDYIDLHSRNTTFADLAAYRIGMVGLNSGGSAQRVWEYSVSGNYFDMLGVKPALGRFFHSSDEHGPNSAPYVVLSDAFWRIHFSADPGVVGKTVNLNKHPFTILGVAPKSFNGTELFFWPDIWLPIVNAPQIDGYSFLDKRQNHGLFIIGTLKPGATAQQGAENLNVIAGQLAKEYPATDDGLKIKLVKPGLMGDTLGGPARPFLSGLMVLAILVLFAACANLAGLFAARVADRTRELAIRLSIGSTRWRILRQLLTEAVLISLAGGVVGTAIAAVLLSILSRWQPISEFPIHVTVVPDIRVYGVALVLSLISGVLPILLAARQIWRTEAAHAMKGGSATAVLHRLSIRDLLLAVQITLCALLVTASLVSVRGMGRALHASLGFAPQGVVLAQTEMRMAGYSDEAAFPAQRQMIREVARIPGVIAVGTIDSPPLSGSSDAMPIFREGEADLRSTKSVMMAHVFPISPGYLSAAGTRLLRGRDFDWQDDEHKPKIALVNETFARRLFGGQSAVGRHFQQGNKELYEIIGIVEDGKYDSLTEEPTAAVFFPVAQHTEGNTTLIVRSQLPPAELIGSLNHVLSGIDSSIPFNYRSWEDGLSLVLFPSRVATAALGVMGLLAAMLAVTGIFGMAAYSVSKRLRELGIRIAMGAQRRQLIRTALGRPFVLLVAGSFVGLLIGIGASNLLASVVYQATSRDPLVLIGAIGIMMLVGLAATWIPARRALAVSPARLLRED